MKFVIFYTFLLGFGAVAFNTLDIFLAIQMGLVQSNLESYFLFFHTLVGLLFGLSLLFAFAKLNARHESGRMLAILLLSINVLLQLFWLIYAVAISLTNPNMELSSGAVAVPLVHSVLTVACIIYLSNHNVARHFHRI